MGVSNRTWAHYLVMNTFLILSSVLAAGVLGRPDGPVGHHVNLGHHQVNVGHHRQVHHGAQVHHSAPVHHNIHPVHHSVHPVHHSVNPVHHSVHPVHHSVHPVHHSVNPVHHNVPVVKAAPQTIAELVVGNPNFSTLLAAVKAAGLVETLTSEGPSTVFAPTNSAFEKVPADALSGLLADKEALTAVLLRHVVPGAALQGKNIPPGATKLETAGGEEITVTRDNYIHITSSAGTADVVLFDVIASNGVVHAVNSVF